MRITVNTKVSKSSFTFHWCDTKSSFYFSQHNEDAVCVSSAVCYHGPRFLDIWKQTRAGQNKMSFDVKVSIKVGLIFQLCENSYVIAPESVNEFCLFNLLNLVPGSVPRSTRHKFL